MAGLKGITVNTAPEDEPHIHAEDDAAVFQSIFGEDGVSSIGQACKATVLSNNKVRIADGVLFVGGHFARIPYGEYVDCEIENGQSKKNRNDIIVAKFKTTGSGGIDTMTCEVKKGTAGTTATDPELTQDDIYKSGKIREFPLYRVKIEGLSIVEVERLFTPIPTNEELIAKVNELNRNLRVYTFSKSATVSYSGNNTMSVKCYRQGNVVTTYISYTGTLPKGIIGLSPSGVSGITIPEGFRPNNEAYGSYVGVAGTSVYEADNGRYRISTDGTIYHGCTDESYHERNVTITYHTDDPIPD